MASISEVYSLITLIATPVCAIFGTNRDFKMQEFKNAMLINVKNSIVQIHFLRRLSLCAIDTNIDIIGNTI